MIIHWISNHDYSLDITFHDYLLDTTIPEFIGYHQTYRIQCFTKYKLSMGSTE